MVNTEIKSLLPTLQTFLAAQPIKKAWLFGSCSRGEETPKSDLDLLVVYDPEKRVSLMGVSRIICSLSKLLGRRVDLVEEGCLRPFAVASVNKDKILIYEREG